MRCHGEPWASLSSGLDILVKDSIRTLCPRMLFGEGEAARDVRSRLTIRK
jgi:hypothetical protein